MSIAIGLYFVLAFCVFCGLIYEVKTSINYYEYQTEKDVLKIFSLALFWPLTLVYIVVMLTAEELDQWLNKGH
jgi:hypothetical protein